MAQKSIAQGPKLGPFDERESHRTLALEVKERKFWVPRDTLASYSPVFKAMLYGEFAEANKDTIKLPEKKPEEIEELLLCLIPTPAVKSVDFSNVELTLKFADEYQIEDLRKRATAAMITMTKERGNRDSGLLEILRIGSKYRMKEALQMIVKRCGMEFKKEEVEAKFIDLRPEVIAALMQYRAGTPVESKCRFEYGTGTNCYSHNCYAYYSCVYCGATRCAKCLETGYGKSCTLTDTSRIAAVVRDLLNRM